MLALNPLEARDAAEVLRFSSTLVPRCTVHAGWVAEGGLRKSSRVPRGWLLANRSIYQQITDLALLYANGVLCPVLTTNEALRGIVSMILLHPMLVRAVVGEANVVNDLIAGITEHGFCVDQVRLQLAFAVDHSSFVAPAESVRLSMATSDDLEQIVAMSAAMAREESNDDPQSRNPQLFRARIKERLTRERDFVLRDREQIVFKGHVASISQLGGHVEGIYVLPSHRGRGLGLHCTGTLTKWVLERAERAVLLVNEHNHTAIALYEKLGYRHAYESRTAFIRPPEST